MFDMAFAIVVTFYSSVLDVVSFIVCVCVCVCVCVWFCRLCFSLLSVSWVDCGLSSVSFICILYMLQQPGPSCLKLTTLLANETIIFQT